MYVQSRLSPRPWICVLQQLMKSSGEDWVDSQILLPMRCCEALTIKEMLAAERVSCLRHHPRWS